MWTNCRARSDVGFSITYTPKDAHVFGFDTTRNTKKTEQNVNELPSPSGKRKFSFLALSTLLETIYAFRLDTV